MEFWNQYGGILSAVISTIGTVLVALLTWIFKKVQSDRTALIKSLNSLSVGLRSFKDETKKEYNVIALLMEELKGRLNLSSDRVETLRDELKKLEGRIENQQSAIISATEKMAILATEIKAVFRVIDAPKRATDRR